MFSKIKLTGNPGGVYCFLFNLSQRQWNEKQVDQMGTGRPTYCISYSGLLPEQILGLQLNRGTSSDNTREIGGDHQNYCSGPTIPSSKGICIHFKIMYIINILKLKIIIIFCINY